MAVKTEEAVFTTRSITLLVFEQVLLQTQQHLKTHRGMISSVVNMSKHGLVIISLIISINFFVDLSYLNRDIGL